MKILVTGSKGTLGTPLVEELKRRGHNVFGIDLFHCESKGYQRADISEYRQLKDIIKDFEPETVYNLAAEFGRNNGEEYYEQVWKTNVIGMRNILEIQKDIGFNLIQASSSEIYGDLVSEYLCEDFMPAPQKNDYAISKWVNEVQCNNFRQRYGNKIAILRFFNAYGPGEYFTPYRSVVCQFCYKMLHNMPITVYKNYHRVFMYIDDFIPTLANACNKFEALSECIAVNIGGEEYRSVEELSDIILKNVPGCNSEIEILPEDVHNIVNKRPDIKLAKTLLNHAPKVVLEEGIIKTLEWMRKVYSI